MHSFDVIVIGSGFGGAVTACRLAEKGMRVLVLERGRRWDPEMFPRGAGGTWLWDQYQPHRLNGWIDMRFFKRMAVAQGSGVGGGSLIYANVSIDANPRVFERGWPQEITYDELKPYYERVGRMLGAKPIPENQVTERYRLMKEAAGKLGHGERFTPVPLAITFDPDWHYQLDDPFNHKHSKRWTNEHGVEQGTCIHCGNCCIGCPTKAKNTLDLNYIPRAERHGAEVRPLHMVRSIVPEDGGYRVHFEHLAGGKRIPGSELGTRVIVAAGSLNSTELLLRCRDQHKTLPNISKFLGRNWSSNGDFLTPAIYKGRKISPTHGPTIDCAIDFLDGSQDGHEFFIENGGWPDVIAAQLERPLRPRAGRSANKRWSIVLGALGQMMRTRDPQSRIMPWFAQGVDAADGRLRLGRIWWAPWKRKLKLDWHIAKSAAVINKIVDMHKQLSEATGGKAHVPEAWRFLQTLITPHPLGGCNMGNTAEDGVVNHKGEVFGYKNLYVADGAIVPRAVGLNPSKTIAALAERIAAGVG